MDSGLLACRALFLPPGAHVDEEKQDPLQACEQKVEQLVEENAELRESAESFGALAERLSQQARQTGATALVCPRCSRSQHVVRIAPTARGHLHCEYCGYSWGSQATVGPDAAVS